MRPIFGPAQAIALTNFRADDLRLPSEGGLATIGIAGCAACLPDSLVAEDFIVCLLSSSITVIILLYRISSEQNWHAAPRAPLDKLALGFKLILLKTSFL
jgi:hypothetical protein